ncbi:MAG: aspartate/glutamate racemase family protein [Gammaproteobacteria bacterium]|nr:aspartate/glutamate racemase family protein [Gammaproteobacteria bacterium]
MRRILVINPNSNESVTEGLRQTLSSYAARAKIDCATLREGPFGIESDDDIESVKPLIIQSIESSPDYDAYVIACYSDPGLAECRRRFDKPVHGMQQSAVETAVAIGGKFGVLALSEQSIARHLAYIDMLGFSDRLAGELPLNITVDQAANDSSAINRVLACGRSLIDDHYASSLILGCAGMAQIRSAAQQLLPVPVIEPAQAAVERALQKEY